MDSVGKFIGRSRLRLNLRLALEESGRALTVCALVAALVAFWFVASGREVELPCLLLGPCAGLTAFAARMLLFAHSKKAAAAEADRIFGMKDALVSFLDFEGVDEGHPFHLMRVRATKERCSVSGTEKIELRIPWRHYAGSLAILLLVAWLCTFADAPSVAARKRQEAQTREKSSAAKKDLLKELEKLKKDLTEEEKEAFARSQLARMVEEMKETGDPREALRQYSSLQSELRKIADKDSLRNDERMLNEFGKKLKDDTQTRELGEKLESGQHKEAAEMLEKMAPEKSAEKMREDKLASAKEKMEKLKRLAEKMEKETENKDSQKNGNSKENGEKETSQKENKSKESSSKETAQKKSGTSQKSGMKESMQKVSKSVSQSSKDMEKAEKNASSSGELSKEDLEKLAGSNSELAKSLGEMSKDLKSHAAQKSFLEKMRALSSALSKGEKQIAGNGGKDGKNGMDGGKDGNPGIGDSKDKKNGPGIGTASAGNFNNLSEGKSPDGVETALKGQKNEGGESLKKVEDANSGSGKSSAQAAARNAEFKRQYESFIRREDVPEGMKGAVKLYFNSINAE